MRLARRIQLFINYIHLVKNDGNTLHTYCYLSVKKLLVRQTTTPYISITSLVREVAVVLEPCESYECGWVTIKIAIKILRFFRKDAQLVGFMPSHYEKNVSWAFSPTITLKSSFCQKLFFVFVNVSLSDFSSSFGCHIPIRAIVVYSNQILSCL